MSITGADSGSAGAIAGSQALRDVALNPATGDIYLDDTGDEVWVKDIEAISSDITSRHLTVLGEWDQDTEIGIDYEGKIWVKNPNLGEIRSDFQDATAEVPGVVEVIDMAVTLESALRELHVDFRARADTGAIFEASTNTDFEGQ